VAAQKNKKIKNKNKVTKSEPTSWDNNVDHFGTMFRDHETSDLKGKLAWKNNNDIRCHPLHTPHIRCPQRVRVETITTRRMLRCEQMLDYYENHL